MTGAERIAAFAAQTFVEGVPEEVLDAAHMHLLDALGVGIASSTVADNADWAGAAPAGSASLLSGGTAEAGAAAMINGALIHALEYDDTHIGSVVHGSAVAAPVALAVAQLAGASGCDLIRAYIVAWEVAIRIGLAAPGAFQAHGFQVTSVGGAIGAAAAAAQVLGLDAARAVSAIGIAGGQASGTLAFLADGAMSKALNPGWAARTGIDAVRLARAGMTGPASVLDSAFGVMNTFAGGGKMLGPQLATLGQEWLIPQAAFKLYPCCHYIHPFLEAIESLMCKGVTAQNFTSLNAFVPPPAAPLVCEPWARRQTPVSGYDGKWGLAYCMALMLVDGRVDVASFDTTPRAEVIEVARKMTWTPMRDHGFPERFAARIELETGQGRISAEVTQVRGAPDRPVETADVRDKFAANAGLRYSPEEVAELALEILEIGSAADTGRLSNLLCA
ncbi:MmgE/PrpD family protein [uncultured Boseongicola sp.]|jgi:2-methylcitrate dehydratase PrpD|uniref:MmgE/PrpD family protein n=1 Tax=uncultured Boseongicola sp. TaxID=1648499 RepID=UPI002620ECC8|nr:MmgE/PrpD family protein [uncultured Boseongicola sp.]